MAAKNPDKPVAPRGRGVAKGRVSSPSMADLTGRILASRRESLGLTQVGLAHELQKRGDDGEDLQALVRWIQRLESGEVYRGRTAPTRARYQKVLEILGFDRDEPALEILTGEMQELGNRLDALRVLMLRVLDRVDGTR